MMTLKGIIQNGQVVLPTPANLPNGTEVLVLSSGPARTIGMSEDEWPTDADGIARLAARMNQVEPFDTSAEEEADLKAWRQKVKEYTAVKQEKKLPGLFE